MYYTSKTDHSQHGNDQKPTGTLRIYAPKIILFVLGCRKKKTRSIRKEKRRINKSRFLSPMGFQLFKASTEFFTFPFQYTSLLHKGNIEVSKGPTTFVI